MVSSWAENSPTATTCRCTGSGSPPSRQEIRRPGFAEESVRVVESCEPRHGSDTERHSRRAVLGSPGLSPHTTTKSSWPPGRARPLSHAVCPSHHTSPGPITHHHGSGEAHRHRYTSPDLSTAPFSAVKCCRAAQHLSNELVEHIRRHRSRPLMSRLCQPMGRSLTWRRHAAR